ncbi:MAG: PAS domain-containing protein [Inquilinus sp.]|nr:PAS domain-containing protein [Inquilinus sp.]
MFGLVTEEQLPIDAIDDDRLARLYEYWDSRRNGAAMPARSDVDPLDLREHIGRIHLIEVIDGERFQYRVYGSRIANPDGVDMTGRFASDYQDTAFAEMTIRHYRICVVQAAPVLHHVVGVIEHRPFEFKRLCLPLSQNDAGVGMILAAPVRLVVPRNLPRTSNFETT